jgi:hypothetical protein
MQQDSMDRLVALFVAATALVVVLACDGASSSSGGSGGSASAGAAGGASAEPSVKVDAATILKEYEANEVAGDNKYKDKVVEITGVVTSVGKDLLDDVYISVGTGAEFELATVQCFVNKDFIDKSATLQKGQKITVTGRVDGVMLNVLVKDCRF